MNKDTKDILDKVTASKKWIVVLSPKGAEIHEGLLGRAITVLPFDDKEIADVICRCFNAHDELQAQRDDLLKACQDAKDHINTMGSDPDTRKIIAQLEAAIQAGKG